MIELISCFISTLIVKIYCNSYSQNNYTNSQSLKYSYFIQLKSKDIIGTSLLSNKITFRYNNNLSSKYLYTKEDEINFLDFEPNLNSKNEFKINDNEIIIPCTKINGSYQTITKIDLENKITSFIKLQNYILENSQNNQCVITKIQNNNYFISFSNDKNNCVTIVFNDSMIKENDIYIGNIYKYNLTRICKCIYFIKLNKFLCMELNDKKLKDKIMIYVLNFSNEKVMINDIENKYMLLDAINFSDFSNFNGTINNAFIEYFNEDLGILITSVNSYYFYLHFLSINNNDNNKKNNFIDIYTDEILREGDVESMKYLKINENYFIVFGNSIFEYICLYLFSVKLKSQINYGYNNNFLLKSTFSNIIFSYDRKNLILINNILGKSLDIYEFSIMECIDNVNIILKDDMELNFKELYIDENYKNVSIYFMEINFPKDINFSILGIYEQEKNDIFNLVDKGIVLNKYYRKVKFNYLGTQPLNITFTYVLKHQLINLNVPSFICRANIIYKYHPTFKEIKSQENDTFLNYTKSKLYSYHNNDKLKEVIHSKNSQLNNYSTDTKNQLINLNETLKNNPQITKQLSTNNNNKNKELRNCDNCEEGYTLLSQYTLNSNDTNCVIICNINTSSWYINSNNIFICRDGNKTCPSDYSKYIEKTGECIYENITYNDYESDNDTNSTNSSNANNNEDDILLTSKEINRNAILSACTSNNTLKDIINLLHEKPLLFFDPIQDSFINDNFSLLFLDLSITNDLNIFNQYLTLPNNCTDNYDDYYAALLLINYNEYPTDKLEYSLFSKNGQLVNLLMCNNDNDNNNDNNNTIIITKQINNESCINYTNYMIDKYNINVLNTTDEFFNDYCTRFNLDNDKVITIGMRRKLYYQNLSFCDSNCTLEKIDLENKKAICNCQIKKMINYTFTGRYYSKFNVTISVSSSKYLYCVNQIFNKNLLKNVAFITELILTIVNVVLMIILAKKSQSHQKKKDMSKNKTYNHNKNKIENNNKKTNKNKAENNNKKHNKNNIVIHKNKNIKNSPPIKKKREKISNNIIININHIHNNNNANNNNNSNNSNNINPYNNAANIDKSNDILMKKHAIKKNKSHNDNKKNIIKSIEGSKFNNNNEMKSNIINDFSDNNLINNNKNNNEDKLQPIILSTHESELQRRRRNNNNLRTRKKKASSNASEKTNKNTLSNSPPLSKIKNNNNNLYNNIDNDYLNDKNMFPILEMKDEDISHSNNNILDNNDQNEFNIANNINNISRSKSSKNHNKINSPIIYDKNKRSVSNKNVVKEKLNYQFKGYSSNIQIIKKIKDLSFIKIIQKKVFIVKTITDNQNIIQKLTAINSLMFYLSFVIFFNAVFYSDEFVDKIYMKNNDKFNFSIEYKKTIYTYIMSFIAEIVFRIYNIFVIKCKFQYSVIFTGLVIIAQIFLVYYVAAFTSIIKHSTDNLFICVALTLCLNLIITFFSSVFIYAIGLLAKKTDKNFMWILAEVLLIL